MLLRPLGPLASCLLLTASAGAASLEFEHAAIERMLATGVMTQGGRLYLDGGPEDRCRHAFVQQPRVDSIDGRLRITLLFSGRQAASVAGRCVGPGGTFDVQVSGVPSFAGGEIYLAELRVEVPGPTQEFFRLVSGLLARQLGQRLRYSLDHALGRAAHQLSSQFGVALSFQKLDVPQIEVGAGSVKVTLDTDATVR